MKNLANGFGGRLLASLAPLLTVLGLLWPIRSYPVQEYSNGGGNCDGDPIDGNDYGTDGGGGTDDDIHADSVAIPSGVFLLPCLADGVSILVVPDFQSGLLSFRILIISDAVNQAEGFDAP